MKARRSSEQKTRALDVQHQASVRIKTLFEDAIVQDFFRAHQDALTRAMIAAAPNDDDARRGAALQLQALLAFKKHISDAIGRGETAERTLSKMRGTTNVTA